ncbi:hypothetical protein GALMADRAFT_252472 [Galerina marginata CBS 339.88]|uniref:Uncharacterized protein n=1 Tax=Galerina marginata (strain CBS 339.88) TaxID=685588 RepID=A0A067SQ33_GALM3|nr:hypothetical protein GALMADRAFT_252472 [Galerina marginata CBS 339.88]
MAPDSNFHLAGLSDGQGRNNKRGVQDATSAPSHLEHISRLHSALPPELLTEIFNIACHADTLKIHSRQEELWKAPFVLSQVCARWRAIVRSTPDTWSHISLCISFTAPPIHERQVLLVKDWLSRSKPCPLVINLTYRFEPGVGRTANGPKLRELLESLLGDSERWSVVHLNLPAACYRLMETIAKDIGNFRGFPLLASLRAKGPEFTWNSFILGLFQTAPALRELQLHNLFPSDIKIAWGQLVSLTLASVSPRNFTATLPKLLNLRYLHITLHEGYSRHRHPGPEQRVIFTSLEEIVTEQSHWNAIMDLFQFMSLPALRNLQLSPLGSTKFTDLPMLLQATNPWQLTRLTLKDIRIREAGETEQGLVDVLHAIRTLEEIKILMIEACKVVSSLPADLLGPTTFSSKGKGNRPTYPLPNLKSFVFAGPYIPSDRHFDESLLMALQLRRPPLMQGFGDPQVHSLGSIRIKSSCAYRYTRRPVIIEGFKALVKGGLKLEIVFGITTWF